MNLMLDEKVIVMDGRTRYNGVVVNSQEQMVIVAFNNTSHKFVYSRGAWVSKTHPRKFSLIVISERFHARSTRF